MHAWKFLDEMKRLISKSKNQEMKRLISKSKNQEMPSFLVGDININAADYSRISQLCKIFEFNYNSSFTN